MKNWIKISYTCSRDNEFNAINSTHILSLDCDSNITLKHIQKTVREYFSNFSGKGVCTITHAEVGTHIELIKKFEDVYKKHFIDKTYKFNN